MNISVIWHIMTSERYEPHVYEGISVIWLIQSSYRVCEELENKTGPNMPIT